LVIKLIDSYKNNINDNNIDMYNLTLNGYKLALPEIKAMPSHSLH